MDSITRRRQGRPSTDARRVGPTKSIDEARRIIAIVRVTIVAASAAVLVGALMNDFWPDAGIDDSGPSGRERLVRFLDSIYLPMLLIATVLAISVFAAVYVERLQLDLRRAQEAHDVHDAHDAHDQRAAAPIGRSTIEGASANGDPPHAAWGSEAVTDDAIWRPSGS